MKRAKSLFSKCVCMLLLCIFCVTGYQLFMFLKEEYNIHRLEKQFIEAKEQLTETGYDFSPLVKKNADTKAWLKIEGTSIDYPVVQAMDNEFYLDHDFNQNKSKAGAIFMDYRNNIDLTDRNTILYGHNMKNGTMFQALNNYSDSDFFNSHRYIKLYTSSCIYTWEVFSTYKTSTSFNYLITDFLNNEDFQSYIETVRSKSQFQNVDPDYEPVEQILTLSTCSGGSQDSRRVVHARLIGEEIHN